MIIIGAFRDANSFTDPETKNLVQYDNTYVHAISGDNDFPDKEYQFAMGKWTDCWKLKTDFFLRSFPDLKNPFEECKGQDVMPYKSKDGKKVTGLIRINKQG